MNTWAGDVACAASSSMSQSAKTLSKTAGCLYLRPKRKLSVSFESLLFVKYVTRRQKGKKTGAEDEEDGNSQTKVYMGEGHLTLSNFVSGVTQQLNMWSSDLRS